jgi:hypothetical protein
VALAEINFDFTLGLQLVLPLAHLQRGLFTKHLGMIVCQIEAAGGTQDAPRGDLTMQFLLNAYEPDHTVHRFGQTVCPDTPRIRELSL